jgi:hypothetical protein
MDKKIAGLLGAAATLTTVSSVHATATPTAQLSQPTSYRDLLEPVPNAMAALKADDARLAQMPSPAETKVAQYHNHHHHHHHHHGFYGGPVPPPAYGPPRGGCYWTLGRPAWNGVAWVRPQVRVCP